MSTFSQNNKDHQIVSDFLQRLITAIGFCIITYITYLLVLYPDEFFSEGTIYDFLVPILLTIGVFPYLYMMMLYIEHQRFIRSLTFKFKDDDLEAYAKRKAILSFNFHLSQLKRWERYITFHDVKSKEDINKSIERVKYLIKRDKTNTLVNFEEGWSHFEARRYLKDYGLMTSYYDHIYHDRWTASSESLKLGEGIFCNKIKYHIDGDEIAVKCLTLILDVEKTELFDDDFNIFKQIGNALFMKAVNDKKELNIRIEEVEGNDEDIYQTYMTVVERRHIIIQKWKHINLDTFELRMSFALDKESFRYADTI